MKYPPVSRFKTAAEFAPHLEALAREVIGRPCPCDDAPLAAPDSPLAAPTKIAGRTIGNRFCIHPMEGWDGTRDGRPSEWTLRRWRNFGLSGAKLIWGGEAVAVRPEGRANPNQLYYSPDNEKGLAELREATLSAHREKFGSTDDLFFGLQITHSGRFARPNEHDRLEARIVHSHPVLEARYGIDPAAAMLTDGEIEGIAEDFIRCAVAAHKLGFDFVDIKHCHGYLLNELLAAKTREGRYGGSFENRTRFLREVVAALRSQAPGLAIGTRVSIFDVPPETPAGFAPPGGYTPENHHFGLRADTGSPADRGLSDEARMFLELCRDLKMELLNITACSPYYSAHIQRPAAYPPVDSRELAQDPLIGALLQFDATRRCREIVPEIPVVGTAYTYLQEYLPHVAQALVREGWTDFAGLGRVVLSYPDLPADVLAGAGLTRKKVCRTFSDCTNGPRMGLISGCYPLDPDYKKLPEWDQIRARKKALGA